MSLPMKHLYNVITVDEMTKAITIILSGVSYSEMKAYIKHIDNTKPDYISRTYCGLVV